MKQVSQSMKDGRIRVLDVPPPTLRPHGILARTASSLISAGTEKAKVDLGRKSLLAKARSRPDQAGQVIEKIRRDGLLRTYRTVKARLEEQGPIGYSSAGIVLAVGELAGGLKPGDRVACGGGEYANHAEIVYVPGNLCVPVPDDVNLDAAAFATVGAIALQGVRQSGVSIGDQVAVVGLGLVGQITVQLLRAAGCEVSGMDPDPTRCKMAAGFGATTVTSDSAEAAPHLLAATGQRGYDAAIVAAATKDDAPVRLAGEIARDRAVVVIVGDVAIRVPRSPFYEKELTLRLSRSYGPGRYDPLYEELAIDYPIGYVRWTEQRNMAEFVRLLAARKLDVEPLITHRLAVDDAAQAYTLLEQPESGALGVLLQYPQAEEVVAEAPRIFVSRPSGQVARTSGVGVGLLGAGNFATATLLPALSTDSRFVRRGVYTTSGLTARDVAGRNGFAFCAGSSDEVLSDPETEAVVIATRHASHADLAQRALRAGKAVFVEKPLAISEEELEAVVLAQRETGGRLTVGFNRRFSPLGQRVAQEAMRRSSPAVIQIRVNAGAVPSTHWTQSLEEGGGRILGEVCHFVDLAAYLIGRPASRVYAASADLEKPAALSDTLAITLSYIDGSVATLLYAAIGDTAYPKERVEMFYEGKVLVIDDFRTLTITQNGRTRTKRLSRSDKGHVMEMRAFLDLAQGLEPSILTFADCVASTATTLKVVESLTTGQPVALPRVVGEDQM